MNDIYTFEERVILRTPGFPISFLDKPFQIAVCCEDTDFMEALYLASPVLYEACMKWKAGKTTREKDITKLANSVIKYYIRMSSRCTPFGLFSGCSLTRWNEDGTQVSIDRQRADRHTRLDMYLLNNLAQHLAKIEEIRDTIMFYSNDSIYRIGNEFRFVEYFYIQKKRNYQISSIPFSEYLSEIIRIASSGTSLSEIRQYLLDKGHAGGETDEFIAELIKAQVLVHELEPTVTGKECLDRMIDVLEARVTRKSKKVCEIIDTLKKVREALNTIDACPQAIMDTCPQTGIDAYRDIITRIEKLGIEMDETKFFQVDAFPVLEKDAIDKALQKDITGALTVLNKLAPFRENENLNSFIRRFKERFEEKEMPLPEVLDTENGIGYIEGNSVNPSPLINELQFTTQGAEKKFVWSGLEVFLQGKLSAALENNQAVIEINDAELESFTAGWDDLPPSLSVMFRLVHDDKPYVFMEHTSGSSAANLLGRFAHGHAGISRLVHDIADHEQHTDPEVIYAEIVHLPESRAGNILQRPCFRKYEIPYLCRSSVEDDFKIDINDLYVSVRNDRVILRSKRLNKQVIPRLSTAHNFTGNTLPVYLFLCDLQLQNKRSGLDFYWGVLDIQYRYLPRVIYGNTILSLARWRFPTSDVSHLYDLPEEAFMIELAAFREKWKLPARVLLAEGDNELLIDLENQCSARALLATIKNDTEFILKESIPCDKAIKDTQGNIHANQFIASLLKKQASYEKAHSFLPGSALHSMPAQRFEPGSEWLYYKLYCGVHAADTILLKAIKPLTEDLLRKGLISKWFFIRYEDPEFHLRIRFHTTDTRKIGEIIYLLKSALASSECSGHIWKTQIDTYNREMSRYSINAIEMAEEIFFRDSNAVLEMLEHMFAGTPDCERENVKWIWSLRCIDELLDSFGLSLQEKISFAENLKKTFAEELNADASLRTQISNKYRGNKKNIEAWLRKDISEDSGVFPFIRVLQQKSAAINELAGRIIQLHRSGRLHVPLESIVSSFVHMMLNRIITHNARKHEMVIYDFLHRYYMSAESRFHIAQSGVWCN